VQLLLLLLLLHLLLRQIVVFISSASSGCSGSRLDPNSISPTENAVEGAWTRTHARENAREKIAS